jgi:TatA/E family protein of Tat protein translocase
MFGMGMPEIILILAIALIVIGPKKLPDLAKSLGRALGEFRKATTDLKESFQIDGELSAAKKAFDQINEDSTEPVSQPEKDAVQKADGINDKDLETNLVDEIMKTDEISENGDEIDNGRLKSVKSEKNTEIMEEKAPAASDRGDQKASDDLAAQEKKGVSGDE